MLSSGAVSICTTTIMCRVSETGPILAVRG